MIVNDYEGSQAFRGALESIASKLAPTGATSRSKIKIASRSGRVRKHVGAHLVCIHTRFDQGIQRAVDHCR